MSDPATGPETGEEAASSIFRRREDGSRLHRALVFLAPIGLALDIVLSLWVSYLHVQRSAIVQVEQQWEPGERLAARAQLIDVRAGAVEDMRARLSVRHDGQEQPLAVLEPIKGGISQGSFEVPNLPAGTAELVVELESPARDPMRETIPIEIVEQRGSRAGEHTISTSMLQWADDTDPQPERLRIDLRPFGRLLAGFDNEFLVRITDPEGKPWSGQVRVTLVHGELAGEVGREDDAPVLYEGPVDPLGMVAVGGRLTSDVIRLEVEIVEPPPSEAPASPPEEVEDPPTVEDSPKATAPLKRRFRYVSFPGGVRIQLPRLAERPGGTLELLPRSLRNNRLIYVDFHDPNGAWIDTLMPAFVPGEQPRAWTLPEGLGEGFVQVEAYHYTNAPGEGTALARIYVSDADPDAASSLHPLIARQRERLELPRIDKEFDAERERKFLDYLEHAELGPSEVENARRWLIGSLPVEVYGPPTALMTQVRDEEALAAKKERWTLALRWFLWGGGGLFILVFALSVYAADRAATRRLAAALGQAGDGAVDDGSDAADLAEQLMTARRSMFFRGAIVIGIMVVTLVLAVMLMESLVWVA